jgi:hypothetical protein
MANFYNIDFTIGFFATEIEAFTCLCFFSCTTQPVSSFSSSSSTSFSSLSNFPLSRFPTYSPQRAVQSNKYAKQRKHSFQSLEAAIVIFNGVSGKAFFL